MTHTTFDRVLNATHPTKVILVGCGGTGSEVLRHLAATHFSLRQIGFQGFDVVTYDPKEIAPHNVGRQPYSPSEVGQSKAEVMTTKINRFYGLNWKYETERYDFKEGASIMITATDSPEFRVKFHEEFLHEGEWIGDYWLDFGNGRDHGQVVLGTVRDVDEPMKTVIDVCPELMDEKDDETQSCSHLQSLNRQDLFINKTLAPMGVGILWNLFKNPQTDTHGFFYNAAKMKMQPIKIR